jgi:hypothetical protein
MRGIKVMRWALTCGMLSGILACSCTPALAAPPEIPQSQPITELTGDSVTLNGELNPGVASGEVEYQFAYNIGLGSCNELGFAPEVPPTVGGNHVHVSAVVTGLQPSTEYNFCLVATHEAEASTSAPLTFTTLAVKPSVDGESVSGVTPFEGILETVVNANNQAASCEFEYGKTPGYGVTTPCEPPTFEGFGDQEARLPLIGLEPGATYHFRVKTEDLTGTTFGGDEEFTTLSLVAPAVESESVSASSLSSSGALLEASIDPEYEVTTCRFEYGRSPGLGSSTSVPCEQESLGSGGGGVLGNVSITGLESDVTYYYRVVAENATGVVQGSVASFTTLGGPLVTTGGAQDSTRTSALVSGMVDPVGLGTNYHFAYVEEGAYLAAVAEGASNPYALGGNSEHLEVAVDLEIDPVGSFGMRSISPVLLRGLLPGRTYHYALVASNSLGFAIGHDASFTTGTPTSPLVTTEGATAISQNTAVVSATIDPQGLATSYGFELATAGSDYGPPAGLGSVGVGEGAESVDLSLTSLEPGTTYHYRIEASSVDGQSFGTDHEFTTSVFPVTFAIPPAPLPFVAAPNFKFPVEPRTVIIKPLTRAQKLTKALAACKKLSAKKRPGCVKRARKSYGPVAKRKAAKPHK